MNVKNCIIVMAAIVVSGCLFTRMNKPLHEMANEKPTIGSYAIAGVLDVVTAPIQVVVYSTEAVAGLIEPNTEIEWHGCSYCNSTESPIYIAPKNRADRMQITCSECGGRYYFSKRGYTLVPLKVKTEQSTVD